MKSKHVYSLFAATLLPFTLCHAQASVILVEDFVALSGGNLHGQNGWVVSGGSTTQHQVQTTGGLSYTSPSNTVIHQGGSNLVRIGGNTEQFAALNFGAQSGDSLYVSFLFERTAGNFFMLGFTQGALPASGGPVAGGGARFSNIDARARIGARWLVGLGFCRLSSPAVRASSTDRFDCIFSIQPPVSMRMRRWGNRALL